MSQQPNYWNRSTLTRRAALRGAVIAGGGAAVAGLAGCGGKKAAGTGPSTAASPAGKAALDPAKGRPGGKLIIQAQDDAGSLVLVKTNNNLTHQLASFTHSGLVGFRNGRPGIDGTDPSVEPDLAQAMPEQPDPQTYVFKLQPAKFQNGRPVTAEDVKYSYERYAFDPDSAYKNTWAWLDHVETPDPQTAVVKTKGPYADALGSMGAHFSGFILAKEYEASPEAANKLMGSGAYLFAERQPPVVTRFRKNPDYFMKPYPYFDEIELLGRSDSAKRVADFIGHKTHVTYWFAADDRDQIKRGRPDALAFGYPNTAFHLIPRSDQPPFNDKRVRQALSMAIDRKAIRAAVSEGEGEPDQTFSWVVKAWGFRKPSGLGDSAKYWNYDPQAAKQLLNAAGVSLPLETAMYHWDASVIGQNLVDTATLIQSQWKSLGIANVKDVQQTFGQYTTTTNVGNFDGIYLGPTGGRGANSPDPGISMKSYFWSPPEGVKVPTTNNGHVNNPSLSALLDKQLTQIKLDERKQTFRQMEELMAEEQYDIALSTYEITWFADPSVKDMQMPIFAVNGTIGYIKYWWLEKA